MVTVATLLNSGADLETVDKVRLLVTKRFTLKNETKEHQFID